MVALLYRLAVLQFASKILPRIGADSWEYEDGVDGVWEDRPTRTLTRILLTYRQVIFVMVYSHLLRERFVSEDGEWFTQLRAVLDHSSQVWWRWFNIFFTLCMWAIELLVSKEDDILSKDWKVD